MVNHRGPEFAECMREVIEGLKPFFGTQNDPLLLTGSGTGALEAAIVNTLSPGDEALAITIGVFGDRFADIAEAFGAVVHRFEAEWGKAIEPHAVGQALENLPNTKAVLLTHNETSTGVTNDIPAIVRTIRESSPECLVLVDGVSSIGALPFEMDSWGVDVAITGSQKAWMSPPGLSMVAISERGWRAYEQAKMPRFYWDFRKAQKNGAKGTAPFTPAVGIVRALQRALQMMHAEGKQWVFDRHRRIARSIRDGIESMGLELFADPSVVSDTVTAVRIPSDVDGSTLLRNLREIHGLVLGSGQDSLKGAIFRIGHMGWVHERDVQHLLDTLEMALSESRLSAAV
jgi:aspartate aminotransferase-like enzyme